MSAKIQPILRTRRLVLRPFELSDSPAVQRLAGDRRIADTTLLIPHPYEDGMAEEWIQTHRLGFERDELAVFAIVLKDSGQLIGAAGLMIERCYDRAELGYWIGTRFWGNGYCTEACIEILRFGFEALRLNKIFAQHFLRNPASARVLQKIGFSKEGRARQHVRKWDQYEDEDFYGILLEDWEKIKYPNLTRSH